VQVNKKLSYRRGTARRAMLVPILSTDVQLYEKSQLKRLAIRQGSWRSLKVIGNIARFDRLLYHFLCSLQ